MSADKIPAYGVDCLKFRIVPFGSYNSSTLSIYNYDDVEYGKLEQKGNYFMLTICLPRSIRINNIIPFRFDDFDTLRETREESITLLENAFWDGYKSKLIYAEICGTCYTVGEGKCDNLFRLVTNSMLRPKQQSQLFVSEDLKKKLFPYYTGMKSWVVNDNFRVKAYDKNRQMGIKSDRELVRFEFCLTPKQIQKTLHNNTDVSSVLTQSSLEKLIGLYGELFDILENKFITPYRTITEDVFRRTFKENHYKPQSTYLMCKELIVDKEQIRNIFKEADAERGRGENSRSTILHLKKCGLPSDTFATLEKLRSLDKT